MKTSLPLLVASIAMTSIHAFAATTTVNTPWSACSRFQPGHYLRIMHDADRNVSGLSQLQNVLSKDVRNFRGVQYDMQWSMFERSPGVYDFSHLDAALAKVKAKNKYLLLNVKERTFHNGCNSNFVPSYVAREVGNAKQKCHAKIWEKPTMDHFIRVLEKVALRYKDDPHFLGITLEETAMRPPSFDKNPALRLKLYEQLSRVYPALHSVAPNLIVHQMMNWPYPNLSAHYKLADSLVAVGGGGGMGWPDTVVSKANSWGWYQVARDYNGKLGIIANVQTGQIGASLSETDKIYNFLVNDIKAHMIVWATWHQDKGGAYLTEVVIPTVNKHNGAVKNTTCPW